MNTLTLLVHVITHRRLLQFATKHPAAAGPLEAWYREARAARWTSPDEMKIRFPKASVINAKRVVFDIGGNNFRLVAKVRWATPRSKGKLFVRFVGTHAEYDKIDAALV